MSARCRRKTSTQWSTRKLPKTWQTSSWGLRGQTGGRPVDTVPVASTDYFFCELTWGPESDAATGQGFRWRGEWYAVGVFTVLHSDASKPRFEYRTVKVVPTHWRPGFSTPYEEAVE